MAQKLQKGFNHASLARGGNNTPRGEDMHRNNAGCHCSHPREARSYSPAFGVRVSPGLAP